MTVTDDDLVLAHRLAEAAGAAIRPHFRRKLAVIDKGAAKGALYDPVTEADKGAEVAIRALLKTDRPEDGIVGEEYGSEAGSTGRNWVLDPIDGTRAFITGQPLWGTLIALAEGSRPVLGVIDQPILGERYIGCKGEAFLLFGGKKTVLKTRDCTKLADAVVMTTHPWDYFTKDEAAAFRGVSDKARMSRFGGDCYAYAALAMGFVDLVIEANLKQWDVAALIPVVEGAGGVMCNWQGGACDMGGSVVAAASQDLMDEVLPLLALGR